MDKTLHQAARQSTQGGATMIRYKPNPITTFMRWLWTWLPELIALLMVIIIAAGLVWIFNMLLDKIFGVGG
jgi:hypothetical protein